MKKFRIIFDDSQQGFLKNSDASAHLVDVVEAETEADVSAALFMKIMKSDRHQISSRPYKIKSIEEIE